MYSAIIVALGALLLIYSLYLCRKMVPLIEWPYLRKPWRMLFYLMLLSLAGYISYIYLLSFASQADDYPLSAVLFAGSVFIVIAVHSSYKLVDGLKSNEITIIQGRHSLEKDQSDMEKLRNSLESKNDEMERILAEVYAVKQILDGRQLSGKLNFESKRMSKLLDELGKNLNVREKKSG